jgi:hypothetical protein
MGIAALVFLMRRGLLKINIVHLLSPPIALFFDASKYGIKTAFFYFLCAILGAVNITVFCVPLYYLSRQSTQQGLTPLGSPDVNMVTCLILWALGIASYEVVVRIMKL